MGADEVGTMDTEIDGREVWVVTVGEGASWQLAGVYSSEGRAEAMIASGTGMRPSRRRRRWFGLTRSSGLRNGRPVVRALARKPLLVPHDDDAAVGAIRVAHAATSIIVSANSDMSSR